MQSGPRLNFSELYDQNVVKIYRYHLARTGAVQDAEDLTAETFRAALEAFDRYQPERAPAAAWLMGIAHHKLVDHFRRSREHSPLDEAEPETRHPPLEDAAETNLRLEQVARALRTLSADRAEAIGLHYFGGLTLAEVGQVMGRSEEAAKKLVHRGLGDLKRKLAGEMEVIR